jgi:hypothetical protein
MLRPSTADGRFHPMIRAGLVVLAWSAFAICFAVSWLLYTRECSPGSTFHALAMAAMLSPLFATLFALRGRKPRWVFGASVFIAVLIEVALGHACHGRWASHAGPVLRRLIYW